MDPRRTIPARQLLPPGKWILVPLWGFFPIFPGSGPRCAGAGTAIGSGIKGDKARRIRAELKDFSMDSFTSRLAVAADMPALTRLMNRAIADLLPEFLTP